MDDSDNHSGNSDLQIIDADVMGPKTQKIYDFLTKRVIGQDQAAALLARNLSVYNAGLKDPDKPIAFVLCAGPTGVGKTLMAQELARFLIPGGIEAPRPPLTAIDCELMQEHHQALELTGAPPSYVGYEDTPKLAQSKIDDPHFQILWRKQVQTYYPNGFPKEKVTGKDGRSQEVSFEGHIKESFRKENEPYTAVVLFDEIEKAHRTVHNHLLKISDEGRISMANGDQTDFSRSVIILTCNINGQETTERLAGRSGAIGFAQEQSSDDVAKVIREETLQRVERFFPPEFVGRIHDSIVVFRPLSREDANQVLNLMLARVTTKLRQRQIKDRPASVLVEFDPNFREHLLNLGYSREYGLRPLKQTIQREVMLRLANSLETANLRPGDEAVFRIGSDGRPGLFRKPRVLNASRQYGVTNE